MEQFIGCDAHKTFSVFVAVNEKGHAGEACGWRMTLRLGQPFAFLRINQLAPSSAHLRKLDIAFNPPFHCVLN